MANTEEIIRFPTKKTIDDIYFIHLEFYRQDGIEVSLESVQGKTLSELREVAGSAFTYTEKVKNLVDQIELPLQTNVTESVAGNYTEAGTKTISSIARGISGQGGVLETVGRMIREGATKSMEGAEQFVSGAARKAINEQMQVIYEGPQRRKYSFEFNLIARNYKDSQEMLKIKKRLQYHASPSLSKGNQYFNYPNMAKFRFLRRKPRQENDSIVTEKIDSLFESKMCYIDSVNIEMGEDGYREFVNDFGDIGVGVMKVSLEMTEAEFMTQKDFEDEENA